MKKATLTYSELLRIYAKVGMNAFGGWSTTYVLLEKELLQKRGLLSADEFATSIASGQSLPGPAQVIITAQTSYFLKGARGAVIGTFFYLLPSVVMTLLFSFLYFTHLSDSDISSYITGVQAAVGGIIIGNAYNIAKRTATMPKLWMVAALAGLLYYFTKIPVMIIVFSFGIAGIVAGFITHRRTRA